MAVRLGVYFFWSDGQLDTRTLIVINFCVSFAVVYVVSLKHARVVDWLIPVFMAVSLAMLVVICFCFREQLLSGHDQNEIASLLYQHAAGS